MAKAKVAVAEKAPDFMSVLAGNAVSVADKPKKGKAPLIKLPKELEINLVAFLEAKKAEEEAKSIKEQQEAPLLSFAREQQDSDGVVGKFAGSYDIQSEKSGVVKFQSADKFSAPQDPEAVNELGKFVDVSKVLKEVYDIKVKAEVLENKDLQKELMALVGVSFSKFFDVDKKNVAVKGLNEDIYDICGRDKVKVAKVREFVRQNKPFIK